ncbi:MAG: antibiotic biosynthesis monooxygenase [Bacteroidales bacterium]
MSFARWNIDLSSEDAEHIFQRIETEGVAVFRAQPGFVRYRLMRADNSTTVAVAEWESQELGKPGAERYRAWMRSTGIMDHFALETFAGEIVAQS